MVQNTIALCTSACDAYSIVAVIHTAFGKPGWPSSQLPPNVNKWPLEGDDKPAGRTGMSHCLRVHKRIHIHSVVKSKGTWLRIVIVSWGSVGLGEVLSSEETCRTGHLDTYPFHKWAAMLTFWWAKAYFHMSQGEKHRTSEGWTRWTVSNKERKELECSRVSSSERFSCSS